MNLYPPLGGRKPGAVALIIPQRVDYVIAPDEGSLWFAELQNMMKWPV